MSDVCFGLLLCWKTCPDIGSISTAKSFSFINLWSKNILPVSISFLQVIISVLRSGLMVSLLHGWSRVEFFMVCRLTVHSCARFWWYSSLGRQFSTWLNHVLVSLQLFWRLQTHLSLVFSPESLKSFPSYLCQVRTLWLSLNFLVLCTSVLDTWKPCVHFIYQSPALWASIIIFLKSKLIPFVFDMTLSQVTAHLYVRFYTVCKLEDNSFNILQVFSIIQ